MFGITESPAIDDASYVKSRDVQVVEYRTYQNFGEDPDVVFRSCSETLIEWNVLFAIVPSYSRTQHKPLVGSGAWTCFRPATTIVRRIADRGYGAEPLRCCTCAIDNGCLAAAAC